MGVDAVVGDDLGAHFGHAVGRENVPRSFDGGQWRAAEQNGFEVGEVFSLEAEKLSRDEREVGGGFDVKSDGTLGEVAAEKNAEAADVKKGECKSPRVGGEKRDHFIRAFGAVDEIFEGKRGDFRFSRRAGGEEERGGFGEIPFGRGRGFGLGCLGCEKFGAELLQSGVGRRETKIERTGDFADFPRGKKGEDDFQCRMAPKGDFVVGKSANLITHPLNERR